jgi:hypothetical protein
MRLVRGWLDQRVRSSCLQPCGECVDVEWAGDQPRDRYKNQLLSVQQALSIKHTQLTILTPTPTPTPSHHHISTTMADQQYKPTGTALPLPHLPSFTH